MKLVAQPYSTQSHNIHARSYLYMYGNFTKQKNKMYIWD